MRIVFGFAAAGLLLAGYTVCPQGVRDSVHDLVSPEQQVLEDMQDGVDTLMAFLKPGPGEIEPDILVS